MGQRKTTPDSTESRDHEEDQQNWPATAVPTIDAFVTVGPQIIFFQHSCNFISQDLTFLQPSTIY